MEENVEDLTYLLSRKIQSMKKKYLDQANNINIVTTK